MKRNLKSKKLNELIGDFVNSVKVKKPMRFEELWRQVVGKKLASETCNIRFKNKTLYIGVKSPYLKADLLSQQNKILKKIGDFNSNIQKIVFD
jgi:hypothetical protein